MCIEQQALLAAIHCARHYPTAGACKVQLSGNVAGAAACVMHNTPLACVMKALRRRLHYASALAMAIQLMGAGMLEAKRRKKPHHFIFIA
jgi:hypothetical protein